MLDKINQPGPSREGFRLHVLLTDDDRVSLQFGMVVQALPMPPHVAFDFGRKLLEKCGQGGLILAEPRVAVQVYDKRVLMELSAPMDEITFDKPYARDVAMRLIETAARAAGRPL